MHEQGGNKHTSDELQAASPQVNVPLSFTSGRSVEPSLPPPLAFELAQATPAAKIPKTRTPPRAITVHT
jgi:hypothetical protein